MRKILALTVAGTIAVFSASSVSANSGSPDCQDGKMANMNAASKAQDNHQDHQKMDGMMPKKDSPKSAMGMNKRKPAAVKKGMNMKKKSADKKPVDKMSNMKDMDM